MDRLWNDTMTTSSSSEMYANSFQSSQEVVNEGLTGTEPVITQQDQIATVSYRPGDVAKPNEAVGEVSVALPVFTPTGTMDFRKWATNGWEADGCTKSGPKGDYDYEHEPSISKANFNANR